MIYEYALDPKLVVDWAVGGIGRIVGQFGMDHRRLVSDFPIDWSDQVVGAFYEHFEYDDSSLEFQNAQPELQAYVQLLSEYTVRRNVKSSERNWLDQAVTEHGSRPFRAILTRDRGATECLAVITPEVLDDIRDTRWYLPTLKPVKKSADDLAAALEPMLRMAQYIVLVDPYFDASDDRYCASFAALIRRAGLGRVKGAPLPKIEVMTGVEQKHKHKEGEFTAQQMQNVANDFRNKALQKLPKCLPNGMNVDFYCLKNLTGGDPLHNRFVLTDIGGVILPYGLAAYKLDEAHSAQDDLQPMLKGIYEARHQQYVKQKGVDIVLGPIRIEGIAALQ